MFRGEFSHSLDAKGRIILPQRLRDGLGEKFIIARGIERCLFVYTLKDWEIFEEKAKTLPISDKNARRFTRFFMGGAYEAEADAQGRTVVPAHLREHAGLTREIVSIGVTNRIEVWSKEAWAAYNETENFVDDELGEYMKVIGF